MADRQFEFESNSKKNKSIMQLFKIMRCTMYISR